MNGRNIVLIACSILLYCMAVTEAGAGTIKEASLIKVINSKLKLGDKGAHLIRPGGDYDKEKMVACEAKEDHEFYVKFNLCCATGDLIREGKCVNMSTLLSRACKPGEKHTTHHRACIKA